MENPSIELINESGTSAPDLNFTRLSSTINRIYQDASINYSWINVILMDSENHTLMNNEYLQHDYPTDILTFEYSNGNNVDGELYINIEVAQENAKEYSVSLQNELERLIIHGCLHLVGYNDHSEEEKKEMRTLEDHYLKILND